MRLGRLPFPDERLPLQPEAPVARPKATLEAPPQLNGPNAKTGAELVAKHGGLDQAMMAYAPDSPEFDHIQAYRYVSTGKRPKGWIRRSSEARASAASAASGSARPSVFARAPAAAGST